MPRLIPSTLCLLFLFGARLVCADDDTAAFGREQQPAGQAAFMGIFYDLSQTVDRKPSGANWMNVATDFLNHGWDEDILNRYYHASRPLFATQIWIPSMYTINAPTAFGVVKTAPHATWAIHYKGQIVPPEDGTYRLVGFGDDALVVALDQKIVLLAGLPHLDLGVPEGTPQNNPLKSGTWFTAKKSDPMDLDVLCCDNGDPNGWCASFILVEEKGKTYDMLNGFPILPILQVAPYDTPPLPPAGRWIVPFAKTPPSALWTAIQ